MVSFEELTESEPRVFGPGTDLVVSLAAVLILVVALGTAAYQQKQLDLKQVLEHQRLLVEAVAAQYPGISPVEVKSGVFGLDIDDSGNIDVTFYNEATLQRLTFGNHILFRPDATDLSRPGRELLRKITQALLARKSTLREIHIQGHADTSPTGKHDSNLHLAALRAMAVFTELKNRGLNPAEILMSATSFGEYLSVRRFHNPTAIYDWSKIKRDNETSEQKRLNRRIEMLLVYRASGED